MFGRKQYSSYSGRGAKSSIKSYIFLTFVAVLAIAGSILFFNLRSESEAIDRLTHCHDTMLPSVIMVLIDSSDPLDNVQKERSIARVLRDIDGQAEFSRIDIYSARPDGDELISPIFSQCKPPLPGSALISDVKAAERFETNFEAGLESAFNKAVGLRGSSTSPLIESLREATTRSFSRTPETTRRRIIIISDMLQNSETVSHYKGLESFERFQSSASWPKAIIDLGNAEVSILYITRSETRNVQGIEHQEWWRNYFKAVNGYLKDVESY